MALFNDGVISNETDLQARESSILNVASTEGVDVDAKLRLAQADIENRILLFLLNDPLRDPHCTVRRLYGLYDVAVTPMLQQWHAEKTIALIYGDAFSNQLNDRYQSKLNEHSAIERDLARRYLRTGVGLVYDPMPQAPAPIVTTTTSSALSADYFFSVAWVNASGQEGVLSDITEVSLPAGTSPVIAASKNPPNAVGWSIYSGTAAQTLTLQYTGAYQMGSNWTLPASGLVDGTVSAGGQAAQIFIYNDNRFQRG